MAAYPSSSEAGDQSLLTRDPAAIAGGMVPRLGGSGSMLPARGIAGTTVMPHVIYLHGGLTKHLSVLIIALNTYLAVAAVTP